MVLFLGQDLLAITICKFGNRKWSSWAKSEKYGDWGSTTRFNKSCESEYDCLHPCFVWYFLPDKMRPLFLKIVDQPVQYVLEYSSVAVLALLTVIDVGYNVCITKDCCNDFDGWQTQLGLLWRKFVWRGPLFQLLLGLSNWKVSTWFHFQLWANAIAISWIAFSYPNDHLKSKILSHVTCVWLPQSCAIPIPHVDFF